MSICGHAGYNSSCEHPAETNTLWCVRVKPSSCSLQLLWEVIQLSCLASQLIRKYSSQASANTDSFLFQIHSGCFSQPGLDGEMLSVSNSAQIHTCVKGFQRKWPSTHNHKLPDSSLLYQKLNICCELSVANLFYSWSVLIGSKSMRLFLCAEGSGSHVSRRVTSPGIFDIFELLAFTLCAALTGVVRRRWFVDILVCYCFQQRCIESVFWFHVFIALQQQA